MLGHYSGRSVLPPPIHQRASVNKILPLLLILIVSAPFSHAKENASAAAAPLRFLPVGAALPENPLTLVPDRNDWTYPLNTPATMRVRLARSPYPAEGFKLRYRLGPDMREGPEREMIVPEQGADIAVPAQAHAGFVRCIARVEIDGKSLISSATLGFAPQQIAASQRDPADFDAFWDQQRAALDKIAPAWELTPAPELSSAAIEVSYLRFQNVGNYAGPSHFYGVLAVPRGAGPFPALLSVPGAGVRPYNGALTLAAKGMITLQVGIHGIPVNLPPAVYEDLGRGGLADYSRFRIDDRNHYYFRRVYLGVLRAADFLARHQKWDRRHLIVTGGSQGGQLSIMTAALDKRVTALAASYPAYSDVSGYAAGGTGGWPHLFKPGANGTRSDEPIEAKLITTAYYDTANFARRLRTPGFYTWGYNDTVTPPTSTFAAYNLITARKELVLATDQGHETSGVQDMLIEAFILHAAGISSTKSN
ncbi:Cephalosporin-C deacetylase [Massilia sp. CF038]|nr:Cephalosporin-C deacetylase [Massilia sp. CF038]